MPGEGGGGERPQEAMWNGMGQPHDRHRFLPSLPFYTTKTLFHFGWAATLRGHNDVLKTKDTRDALREHAIELDPFPRGKGGAVPRGTE